MLKITAMPKETLAELLLYLSENERFESVSEKLGSGLSVEEVRAVLRELAREVSREAASEHGRDMDEIKRNGHLAPKTKKIISYLSDHEEKKLFSAFGLLGK
ncbi:MAG TPA: hypothetical protein PLZ86_06800 [bacterium]|nr:hypothetical protein [bacterium]